MKYLLTIVLLFSFNQTKAEALVQSLYTGNQLLDRCEAFLSETGSVAKGNTCFGYIGGISDSHENFVSWGGIRKSGVSLKIWRENN